MSSEIPQIPQPVPFTFHRGKDKTYTTVYQAVDFPLDHFAIFKQNPVNRDRITEANKMLYSLQKQINQLREALIALAMTVDTEVEKKVDVEVTLGEGAEPKSVKATLLDETYTVEIEGVTFGEATTIEGCFIRLPKPAAEGEGEEDTTAAAAASEEEEEEMYIEVTVDPENPITCEEGGKVTVSGKAKSVTDKKNIPKFTITKSEKPGPEPPEPTDDLKFTIKIGDAEATEMTTTDNLTFSATFEEQTAGTEIKLTASKAGYKLVGTLPTITTQSTGIEITVEANESETEAISETITVQA
jgi:hypothetical protein